ncbi:hypothetical protein CWE15_11875 [Aliidiomarina taiwanensis]|uniref:Glycosyl transferase family 1 domain-containing protein n=1 Tax=Aliidiomarina taiwanensis TaxID=946228 RepID=A0A432WTF0_9GAMM|nr:glycosyltransferase [Aliidiomarina taiwanensis]RUO37049.1 hypothetical protein CWE15_11875 [Aliidiomarina taiwanensis]
MNVLINFGPLKSGGGQNVALNFLYSFQDLEFEDVNYFFIVAEGSEPHNQLIKLGYSQFYVFPRNPIKRILYEKFLSFKIIKDNSIDIIYSYFGFGLFPKHIPQVCGSADSNLYFPEVDFWSDYKGHKLLLKKIIDKYRLFGVKRCNGVVFENKSMELRGRKLYSLENTAYIKPSIKRIYTDQIKIYTPENTKLIGLFLCGWQLNKNIMMIPEFLSILKNKGLSISIILTAPENNCSIHKAFVNKLSEFDVEENVNIIGIIDKEMLQALYSKVSFVFLLSKLESFSNNIIEAWEFERPLIVANEEWARAICKNGAVYVDRDSPIDIAENVLNLYHDEKLLNSIVENGKANLSTYPSIEERIKLEIDFLRSTVHAN